MQRTSTAYPTNQPETIARLATAYDRLREDAHSEALELFAEVLDTHTTRKFFLHWYWAMYAKLGLCDAWLAAGNLRKARTEAERFREAASSTAEPNLQALAWDAQARVAMAAKDWKNAEAHIAQALAILDQFEIPTTAWRIHATRCALYRHAKDERAAETHRARAEAIVLGLAESFARGEPLREAFLQSAPVRQVRRRKS